MIDIRNYKVVYKNKVYLGLMMTPEFDVLEGDTFGQVLEASALTITAMNMCDGKVVQIWDKASEFGFVRGS